LEDEARRKAEAVEREKNQERLQQQQQQQQQQQHQKDSPNDGETQSAVQDDDIFYDSSAEKQPEE
jgi:hypothetical protein